MQVFLCWSGDASHKIAEALHGFLGDVIQDLKPFLSSESIRKGQRWANEIGKRLADTNYGIVCLTKDNLSARWILFESGALSKNIADSRVTALLAGIQPTDVVDPLSQFQQTRAERSDILKLVKELNELLPVDRRLEADRLTRAFDSFWTPFETKLNEAIASAGTKVAATPKRDTEDMVSELLELVREMKRELGTLRPSAFSDDRLEIDAKLLDRVWRYSSPTSADLVSILTDNIDDEALRQRFRKARALLAAKAASAKKKNDDTEGST